jgi:hypothetical protein
VRLDVYFIAILLCYYQKIRRLQWMGLVCGWYQHTTGFIHLFTEKRRVTAVRLQIDVLKIFPAEELT